MTSRKLSRAEKNSRATVAGNILWLLDSYELTVEQFAKKAKVSRSHIFNILNESSSASTDLLARIARAFDLEPSKLLK